MFFKNFLKKRKRGKCLSRFSWKNKIIKPQSGRLTTGPRTFEPCRSEDCRSPEKGRRKNLRWWTVSFNQWHVVYFKFSNREGAYLEQNDDSRRRVVVLRVAVDEADLQRVGAFSWGLLKIKKQKGRQGRFGLQGKTLRVRTWRIALCVI